MLNCVVMRFWGREKGLLVCCMMLCSSFSVAQSVSSSSLPAVAPLEVHEREVEGCKMRYAIRPNAKAPVLVFVHGSPGDWKAYKSFMKDDSLAMRYELISVDRPGYTPSEQPAYGRYARLSIQSKLIRALLSAQVSKRPLLLVGHSYGGPVVLQMALDAPKGWVDGVLLIAPALDPLLEKRWKWRLWVRHPLLRWMVPEFLSTCNEEIISLKKDLLEMEKSYDSLDVFVYFLHGARDILVPVATRRYVRTHLGKKKLWVQVIKKANHFIPWTHQQEIYQGLDSLYKELGVPSSFQ